MIQADESVQGLVSQTAQQLKPAICSLFSLDSPDGFRLVCAVVSMQGLL
jgi:hypothetical protein